MTQPSLAANPRMNLLRRYSVLFNAGLIVLCLTAFFLPAVIAQYGSNWYYVRGIDMVMGRAVPGDSFGMVPQPTVAFALAALVLSLICTAFPRRDKVVFLSALLNLIALLLLILPAFGSDETAARSDSIRAAFRDHHLLSGYWLLLLCALLAVMAGAFSVLTRPALRTDLIRSRWIYAMAAPVLIYVLIFFYYPVYGVLIAFKDFSPKLGILGSHWVGFEQFENFFCSVYFLRLLRNTLLISFYSLLFGFTFPILFAICLSEVRNHAFKRTVQTITYLPYFISLVVVCGLLTMFLSTEGLFNQIAMMLGASEDSLVNYLGDPSYFRSIYVVSGIWQNFGWNSIIYLAVITNIDPELYEAASVDGAQRFRKMLHITLPSLMPTVTIMLILAIGGLMNVGFEKIILLYNTQTYETADVISSFVYRRGIIETNFSFATAVDLFNAVISFALIITANRISRSVSETSLW